MKPFKFSLQSLRTVRQRQEQEALEAYARALLERTQAQRALDRAQQDLNEAQMQWQQQAQQGCCAVEMARFATHCEQLARRRDQEREKLSQAERIVNTRLAATLHARQQREVVDKLQKRQRLAYDHEIARAEQQFLDDLAQRRPEASLTPVGCERSSV
jgi:flagellar export protein FliJ